MEEKVVKKIAPFTPLAKPLERLDPMPVFRWEEKIEQAPEFRLKMERTPMPEMPLDPMMDPIRQSRDEMFREIENFVKKNCESERSNHMMSCHVTLGKMMTLVDNTTPVRIDVKGEEMALTPHRLALYEPYEVRKMFINCQAELEMELEDR